MGYIHPKPGDEGMPDGLAIHKIFRFEEPAENEGLLFIYYLEYGDECIVRFANEGMADFAYIPAKALLAFADHFRKELAEYGRS